MPACYNAIFFFSKTGALFMRGLMAKRDLAWARASPSFLICNTSKFRALLPQLRLKTAPTLRCLQNRITVGVAIRIVAAQQRDSMDQRCIFTLSCLSSKGIINDHYCFCIIIKELLKSILSNIVHENSQKPSAALRCSIVEVLCRVAT